jgi:KTSC domain-containing protein
MPQMTRIRSTSVVAVGYDEGRHELTVRFVSGDTYVYAMVPPSVYRSLLESESVGRFVNGTIKPTYPVRPAA